MSEELIGTKFNIKTKYLWHSTQIYCLAFDKKGKFIFTGGDDGVLRVYSITKDRLIKSLSYQNTEVEFVEKVEEVCRSIDFKTNTEADIETLLESFAICDIAVNHENTLVSAGKQNGMIFVWNLQSFDLVIKFEEQVFPIRSVIFSPVVFNENQKYLISTSEDGFMFFYTYNYKTLKFEPKSVHRKGKFDNERALNISVDMTPGGVLLGIMHTFGVKKEVSKPKSKKEPFIKSDIQSAIRICSLCDESGLKEEWKTTYHKSHSDCVYTLRFSHNTFRFASACDKDTNAFIWTFDKSNKKWDSIIIGIEATTDTKKLLRGKSKQSIESVFVEEIAFSCDDKHMITILTDFSIKVWNSESGELVRHFNKYHNQKISIVECHPTYGHIFLSAGYDSNIYIYDIIKGTILQHFDCSLETEQIDDNSNINDSLSIKPLILQCCFSPDGQAIAATDNYGNLTVFALESRQEVDCLDQLEAVLFRMHSGSDEENCLTPLEITASEDNQKFSEKMFEYESDLLKGIEKPSPLKQNQNSNAKKKEEKNVLLKSVKKLNFETESVVNQIKSSPKKVPNTKVMPSKKKTPTKKSIETTSSPVKVEVKAAESPPKDTEKTPISTPKSKQAKFPRFTFSQILDEIFENPSSRPFQINDEIEYPTFRKEISDADLSLTSIREDMLLNSRYSFAKFNKDMNKVMENAKTFYKKHDEEVYEMALTLEKFYCSKMETQFGQSFKPPKKIDLTDDEMSETSDEKSSLCTPVPKTTNESDLSEESSKVEFNSPSLRSQSTRKDSPKVNGNKTPKRKQSTKKKGSNLKNGSNRKRTTIIDKSPSDSESTPGKRTKIIENLPQISSTDDHIEDETHLQTNNDIREDIPQEIAKDVLDNVSEDITENNAENIDQDVIGEVSVETQTEELQSNDSQTEQLNDFGVVAEEEDKEEEQEEEQEKEQEEEMEIALEESGSKTESVVNGTSNILQINCDNQSKQSSQLKNCLFCIFCEKIFWAVSEAKSHYIYHLCPLKCSKCNELFAAYDQYLSHDCGHPNTSKDIEFGRQYSDCINWIEKFLDFQQSEDIESFETIDKNNKRCIVCEKVGQFRLESSQKKKEIKKIDPNCHLEKHLKYVPQYQCLICLLNNDKYYYCRNSGEAEQHLSKEHSSYPIRDTCFQYFDGSIPKLDEIMHRFHS